MEDHDLSERAVRAVPGLWHAEHTIADLAHSYDADPERLDVAAGRQAFTMAAFESKMSLKRVKYILCGPEKADLPGELLEPFSRVEGVLSQMVAAWKAGSSIGEMRRLVNEAQPGFARITEYLQSMSGLFTELGQRFGEFMGKDSPDFTEANRLYEELLRDQKFLSEFAALRGQLSLFNGERNVEIHRQMDALETSYGR